MKEKISTIFSKNTIVYIFSILTLTILGLEYFLYQFEKNRLLEDEERFLRFVAEKEEKLISEWYVNTKIYTEVFVNSEYFKSLLNNFIRNTKNYQTKALLDDIFKKEVVDKDLITVVLYDSEFNRVYSFQNIAYEISPFTKEKLRNFNSDNFFYVSRIYKKRNPIYENLISVCEISVGLFTKPNLSRPDYYLVFISDARKSIFPLINTYSAQRSTLETVLLAEENNELIYLNDLRFIFNSDIVLKANVGAEQIPGKKINVSKKGILLGVDYRGEKVIAYTTYLPALNWFLVTKIDEREVIISTNKILYTISGSIILIMFLFIVILGVLWKKEEVEKIKKELEVQKMQNLMTQKYQIISKYANDAFFLISKDGTIVEANDKAVDMYGYSVTELKGRPFVLLETPENRVEWSDLLNRLKNDSGAVYEAIHIDRLGHKLFVEISAKIISINNELFLVAIVRSIEDRKKAEIQLRESEKKFHTLFEQAYDPILVLKKDLIIDCNSKAGKLFKIIKEDLVNQNFKNFIAESDQQRIEEFFDVIQFPEKVIKKTFQLKLRKANNEEFDAEINLSVFELGGERVTQVFVRDITERKKFQEHLEKLKRAIENTDEMMMITDVNGVIEYVNPAFELVTGYTLDEIRGKRPNVLKSGKQPQEFYKQLWTTILSGKSWEGIIVNKKKDGALYTEEMVISPIKNENNKIISFVAVKKDVTERIRAEEELKRARLKAEESDRIKSNFLSMMSHEVRTPLNVILGFIDIIKTSILAREFPEKEHIFNVIERNSKRLINLINDIIDISRIESNEMKLDLNIHEAKTILRKSIQEFIADAQAKNLSLNEDLDIDDVYITVDVIRFHQIISNLLSNAIKFTSSGEVRVISKVKSNRLYISVKDTGIGISKEFIPHLFEFFRQAEEGYNRNFEGAGLGLAITKKLVTMMNGEIYIESELNKGSTFTVVFPIAMVEKPTVQEEEAKVLTQKIIDTEEPVVLIVEDNLDNSYFVEVILNKLGLNYYSATKSDEALNILKNKKVDLILLDISLAGDINGEEVLKIIKQNDKYKNIPIIAMTAHAMLGDKEYFLSVGFDDYLAKPFTFDQLTEFIFKYLNKK